jgi:hypothetical protein
MAGFRMSASTQANDGVPAEMQVDPSRLGTPPGQVSGWV